jgi:uncharacterized membrane protein YfcA
MTGANAVVNARPGTAPASVLRGPLMKFWFLYVGAFYLVYLFLIFGQRHGTDALAHWPIAIAMSLGSVVAGSTPMGGGTIGFPVLVLLLHQSASIGRNFGMAAQALGMTSAMIFIICRRTPLQWLLLGWGIVGAAAGLLAGTFIVSPLLPASIVKLLFSSVWMSFGILTVTRNREICSLKKVPRLGRPVDVLTAIFVGLLGGMITSIIGVGIEMVVYTVLVLRYRCDLKAAVPTAVSLGAMTSVMGIGLHGLLGDIGRETFYNWLAAAPIIVFGAPLGAYLVSVIPRIRTLYFVSFLCLVQFVWTLYQVSPKLGEWIFVAATLAAASLCFYFLYRRGTLDEMRMDYR